ncbi:hypothetical protein [Bacillus methanolicus]|uniref:hypothetical protein n=1 Tax=Bacillus methanolicus TaxID=1471 RepID=UPI002380A3A2|nr:hypothetical protein [Bacillus methanolicus]
MRNNNVFCAVSINAETQTNTNVYTNRVEIYTAITDAYNSSIAINGNEIHVTYDAVVPSFPNSRNIFYVKGTINADGSVTWGAVEQWTTANNNGSDFKNPTIQMHGNIPMVFAETPWLNVTQTGASLGSSYRGIIVLKRDNTLTTHTGSYLNGSLISFKYVYSNTGGYTQSSPSACVDKNGRIWVAWSGTDATDSSVNNIRVAYSDDGGVTWSAMTKLTSGNSYSQDRPSITVNRNNEVFIVWHGRDVSDVRTDIRMIKYSNGSWGSISTVSAGTTNHKYYPSVLFDTTLDFSTPLFIYQDLQSGKVGFYGTWTITTISVTPGYIGQKTSADKSNILSYSITTDGTMSTITEKINGTTIATRTNPTNGQQFTVSLSQAQWDAIKYGNAHTLTIEMGSDTWTYTFDKRLNANDDILSAVKGVQDLQSHLNGIKAQLGSAIRSKGGTVNDTDAWSAFVSAVSNMQVKRWASGSTATVSNLTKVTINNLTFTPSLVYIYTLSDNAYYQAGIVTNTNLQAKFQGSFYDSVGYANAAGYAYQTADTKNNIITNGFEFTNLTGGSSSFYWVAYE